MEPYTYKDSGIEWLGEIPRHWKVDRLKDVTRLRDEKIIIQSEEENYLELEDIEQGTGKIIGFRNTMTVASAVMKFESGDVLFGKLRPYLTKYHLSEKQGFCTGEILAIKPFRIDGAYLKYFVGSPNLIEQCNVFSYGAKMPRVNWHAQLGTFCIAFPPPPEQKAIAAYLEQACARIDRIIGIKEEQLGNLAEVKKAKLFEAVTGRKETDEPRKQMGFGAVESVPESWQLRRLKSLGRIRYGLGQPPKELVGGLPIIRATNVYRGRIDTNKLVFVDPDDIPYERDPVLKEGDIIVVRSGAYTADSAIIPKEFEGAIAGYDMVMRCYDGVSARFVSYALLSSYVLDDQLKLLSLRAAQPHLNKEELGGSRIVIPPYDEQERIADQLDRLFELVNSTVEKIKEQIEILKNYRKSLIHECVTGKKQVVGVSPNFDVEQRMNAEA
jgi:type I restriction enzyme, S subunit